MVIEKEKKYNTKKEKIVHFVQKLKKTHFSQNQVKKCTPCFAEASIKNQKRTEKRNKKYTKEEKKGIQRFMIEKRSKKKMRMRVGAVRLMDCEEMVKKQLQHKMS